MRLDGTVAVSVDGRPARLTATGAALRLQFPDPAAARRALRGHRGAGSAVAGALTAAGVTLRVYGGRHLLLVLGAGSRPGRWRLLTRSPDVRPAGVRALLRLLLPGLRPRTG